MLLWIVLHPNGWKKQHNKTIGKNPDKKASALQGYIRSVWLCQICETKPLQFMPSCQCTSLRYALTSEVSFWALPILITSTYTLLVLTCWSFWFVKSEPKSFRWTTSKDSFHLIRAMIIQYHSPAPNKVFWGSLRGRSLSTIYCIYHLHRDCSSCTPFFATSVDRSSCNIWTSGRTKMQQFCTWHVGILTWGKMFPFLIHRMGR